MFSRRNRKGLVSHSGLLVLDYDDVEAQNLAHMKEIATSAAHTAAAFVSPSGNGIKVLVVVEPKPTDAVSHTIAWRAAAGYYDELLSATADSSGKDLPRLTLLAHDPSAYLAEEVAPLTWEASLLALRNRGLKAFAKMEQRLSLRTRMERMEKTLLPMMPR